MQLIGWHELGILSDSRQPVSAFLITLSKLHNIMIISTQEG